MITVTTESDVCLITLDRPDKANALTGAMLVALEDAVAGAAQARVKALVLTGAGNVFSAGADLDEAAAGLATDAVWERLSFRIANLPCMTIAALNGTLAGGAMGMVLACDIRIAVPEARFFYPVMRLGHLPQPSDVARLGALVGPGRARMLLMAGVRIDADEARDWGLIDRIVPADDLLTEVATLLTPALGASVGHVGAIKAQLLAAGRGV